MSEVSQEVNAGAEQVGAGEQVKQTKIEIRIAEHNRGVQTVVIGAVYTEPVHIHVTLGRAS